MALLLCIPAQAQFNWGIKGGVNLGNNDLTVLKDKSTALDITNYTGFFIGPKAEVRIPILGFGIEGAALYSQKGMTMTDKETFMQNSILIPINIKYNFGLGNFANIFVAAGPEFGFNVGETSMVFNDIRTNTTTSKASGGISAYVVEKSTLSINVGIGATLLNHLQMAINYNMPWGNTGEFQYIDASEIENAENLKNGENISFGAFEKMTGTIDKAKQTKNNIKAGTVQLSLAYLF